MFTYQLLIISLLTVLSSFLIILLFKKFERGGEVILFFVIPLFIFSLGFALRLSTKSHLIDLGFFLTEFAQLFIYALFAACVLLGQLKYWKK